MLNRAFITVSVWGTLMRPTWSIEHLANFLKKKDTHIFTYRNANQEIRVLGITHKQEHDPDWGFARLVHPSGARYLIAVGEPAERIWVEGVIPPHGILRHMSAAKGAGFKLWSP